MNMICHQTYIIYLSTKQGNLFFSEFKFMKTVWFGRSIITFLDTGQWHLQTHKYKPSTPVTYTAHKQQRSVWSHIWFILTNGALRSSIPSWRHNLSCLICGPLLCVEEMTGLIHFHCFLFLLFILTNPIKPFSFRKASHVKILFFLLRCVCAGGQHFCICVRAVGGAHMEHYGSCHDNI